MRMRRPEGAEWGSTQWTVTARTEHECHGYRCSNWIEPGERYARLVAFPCADWMSGQGVWVMKLCRRCFTEHGKEMPPTQAERRAAS